MIALYQRLIRNCHTVNLLNRVHIALENRMTPWQLFTLGEQCVDIWPDKANPSRSWIESLCFLYLKSGKEEPEKFIKKTLNSHLLLYTSDVGQNKNKTLIVCFTGMHQRMMMPIPVFLQQFDASKADIIVVRAPKKNGFRYGIEGIGEDFKKTISNLENTLSYFKYERVISIGTSAGAAPALIAALRHGFACCLAVGINSPVDDRWYQALSQHLGGLAEYCIERLDTLPKCFLLCGDSHMRDIESTFAWADYLPVKIITVPTARHNSLMPLLQVGKLAQFFEKKLFHEKLTSLVQISAN